MIGCGRIGFLLEDDPLRYKPCTHYGGAKEAGISVTHACDINPGRLDRFTALAGISADRSYTDYRALIAAVRPRTVIIATNTDTHAEIGIMAAEHGAGVIMCEKPIAHSLEAARRLIDSCERNGARLVVNHERRYESRYRKVRRMIESGAIGTIKSASGCILTGPYRGASDQREGGGPLLHDGTHLVDIIRFFFGDLRSVEGAITRDVRTRGFEDRAVAWLLTRSGIDVFVEAGGSREYFAFELQISGTAGKIVIGNGYEKYYRARPSRHYRGFRDLRSAPFPRVDSTNCFARAYREIKALRKDPDRVIVSSGLDGYRALEAIHAIYLSASRNGKRIELPVKPDSIDLGSIFDLA